MTTTHSTDRLKDTASLDFYMLDGIHRYDMIGAISDPDDPQSKISSDVVGSCFQSTNFNNNPNLHLADYFQADSMKKQYETQAELVFKIVCKSAFIVWKIIQMADRYGWSTLRAKCIPICAKDSELYDDWEMYALQLKSQTLVEILKASRLP